MEREALQKLNESIEEDPGKSESSYGLKNIHRRIRLFYGEDCGLKAERNGEGGLTVEIRILKRTIEEHEHIIHKETEQI